MPWFPGIGSHPRFGEMGGAVFERREADVFERPGFVVNAKAALVVALGLPGCAGLGGDGLP